MSNFQFRKTAKPYASNQYVVKYRPGDAKKPRPEIDGLWCAVARYSSAVISNKNVDRILQARKALAKEVKAAGSCYPGWGIAVLENGQDMFATH